MISAELRNVAEPVMKTSPKKRIFFTHYKTGEEISKIVSELPHLNSNPNNARMIYWNHTDDCFEDISKKSIIRLEDIEE